MATVCEVGDLPLWRGAQETPEVAAFAPFAFRVDDAGLVRLAEETRLSEVVQAYADDSYHFITSPPGSSRWGNVLAKKSIDGLLALHPGIDGQDVLELGGGTTYSARYLVENAGARHVTIIDPAVHDDPSLSEIEVRREYFGPGMTLDRAFPLIMSFNTLEHVPDPESFLRGAREHLSDDGYLYLKMPECEASLAQGDLGLCVHEHLSYFTTASLDALLARAGFERVGDANYLGALQVLARKAPPAPEVAASGSETLLDGFEKHARRHVDRLRTMLDQHQGGTIAVVGASAGLANILHLAEATERGIAIYDGDELKSGRFLPGIDTPIRHSSDASLGEHDLVLVTPVNFFDEISESLLARSGFTGKVLPMFEMADG